MTLTSEDMLAISRLLDVKVKSALQSELQPVKDDIRDMRAEMGIMRNDLQTQIEDVRSDLQIELNNVNNNLQSQIDKLDTNIRALSLKVENNVERKINLLAENYMPAAKRYEKESAELEAMKVDIEIMKGVIENHSEMLQKLA